MTCILLGRRGKIQTAFGIFNPALEVPVGMLMSSGQTGPFETWAVTAVKSLINIFKILRAG